jgi:hypothetical protein
MRTGLIDVPATVTPESLDVVKRLMALSLSLVSRAGTSAATYAAHAGRPSHTLVADVNRALMYQSKTFMHQVTDEEVAESYEVVEEAFQEDDDDSDDDTDGEQHQEKEVEWTLSACTCEVCVGMNEAADTWDTYEPEDEVLQYLKSRTDAILAKKI